MKSRAALKAALLELVGERPFSEITAAMIVARAGVGYATFFRHYRDTTALLTDVADQAIEELVLTLAPTILGAEGRRAASLLTAYVDERRAFFRALLFGAGEAVRSRITARVVSRAAAARTDLPGWLPRDLAVVHLSNAVLTAIGWWLERGEGISRERMADILYRLIIAPALAGKE